MGNQLTRPDKLHGTRIVGRLPQLSREEALHIRDQVLHDYGDLSRGLKTIIAEELVLMTRKLKAAQEELNLAHRRNDQAGIKEARTKVLGIELEFAMGPLSSNVIVQIKIEREQAETNRIAKLLADIL